MISVVIPAHNVADTLGEQLAALSRQTYQGSWEVVVADNGSTDATRRVAEGWRERLPGLRVIDASARPGAAAARNMGAEEATGEHLLYCDADDLVEPDWVAAMAAALEEHDFVAGAIDHDSVNPGHTARWHYRSHVEGPPLGLRFLPYATSANLGVSRRAFEAVGGFDEEMGSAGEDVDLSWRLQLAGYPLHFEPRARVAYRHRHELARLWGQHVAYGAADPLLYKRFRDQGVPARPLLRSLRDYLRLVIRLPELLHPGRRAAWIRGAARQWGRLRGSVRARVLYL